MNKYFKLFEEIVLVPNTDGRGALYNLLTGNVYELTKNQAKCLLLLENGSTVDDIIELLPSSFDLDSYLKLLVEESFGYFSSTNSFIPKMYHTDSLLKQTSLKIPPSISKVFIILENNCNQDCDYCDTKYVRQNACIGCFRQKNEIATKHTSFEQYLTFLHYMKKIKAQTVYFTGGDLLAKWDDNLPIIKEAVNLGFQHIFIILGGVGKISQKIINQLNELNVHPIYQVIVNEHGLIENHDLIANASQNCYFCLLYKTHDSNIIIDSANKINQVYNLKGIFIDRLIKKSDIQHFDFDFLRPKRTTSVEDFSFSLEYNQCLNGTISLNTNQEIIVCPRLTELVVGHIDNCYECLSEKSAQLYWGLTKDKIKLCRDCHLRYICGDCRFLEMSFSQDLYSTVNCIH